MAISATFVADFTSWKSAVDAAQTQLRGFQTGASQLEGALKRVADSFSGRKILSEATLAVKAVTDLGGVAKLTEREQQRLNVTLTEAVAKYKALGQTAPKALTDMEHATRAVDSSTSVFGGTMAGLGKSILATAAGFFTAQAAFAAVKTAIRLLADELQTLTLHGAAVADVGDNFDHLTAQAGRLGSSLLGELRSGTHGTIADFDLMKTATQDLAAGLNLTDAQFGTLAKGAFALAQATGGDVATALDTMNDAMLTGRTRSLALLTGKIDLGKAEEEFARTLGTTAKNLSDEGKLEAARIAILKSVGEATGRLGEQTDGLDEKVAQAQTAWTNFQNELGRTVATSPVINTALDHIGKALTDAFGTDKGALVRSIATAIDDAAIALVGLTRTAVSTAGFIVTEWYAVKKIYGDVRQVIDGVVLSTLYLGKAQLTLPNAIGLGTAAWKANDDAIGRLLVSMKERGAALQADDKAQKSVGDTTEKYRKTLDAIESAMKKAKVETAAHAVATVAVGKAVAGAIPPIGNFVKGTDDVATSARKAAVALAELEKQVASGESWEMFNAMNIKVAGGLDAIIARGKVDLNFAVTPTLDDQRLFQQLRNAIPNIKAPASLMGTTAGSEITAGLSHVLAGVPDVFIKAFTGGGGLLGALKAIGVQLADAIVRPIMEELTKLQQRAVSVGAGIATALGGAVGGGAGATVAGLASSIGVATGAAAGLSGAFTAIGLSSTVALGAATLGIGAAAVGVFMLVKHFTGLSDVVKQSRKATDEFTTSLGQTLTQVQGLEVKQLMAAGASQKWAVQTIALRDAYVLAGLSIDVANAAVQRLHAAEQKGGTALATVLNEIADVLKMAAEAQKLADAAAAAAKEFEDLVASFDGSKIFHDAELAVRAIEHLGGVTRLTKAEQQRLNELLKTAIEKYEALGLEVPPALLEMFNATVNLADETARLKQSADDAFTAWTKTYNYIKAGGSNVNQSNSALSPENYATKADWQKAYLQHNANARPGQIESAWMSNSVVPDWAKQLPSFAGGSGGYKDFGRATLAVLHGREEVRTEGQANGDTALLAEIQGMRRDFKALPRVIRDAILLAAA